MSKLRPAYVAIIERQLVDRHNSRGRKSTTRYYVTETGDESLECSHAYASRDRRVLETMIQGVDGGRVLEWMLSDGRING